MEERDILIAMMEEYPELFYDTTELDGLNGGDMNDCVTQKTIKEWEQWIEEKMKNKE